MKTKTDTLQISTKALAAAATTMRKLRVERNRLEAKANAVDRKLDAKGKTLARKLTGLMAGDIIAVRDEVGRLSYHYLTDAYVRPVGVAGRKVVVFLVGRRCTKTGAIRNRLARRFNHPGSEVIMPPVSRLKDRQKAMATPPKIKPMGAA